MRSLRVTFLLRLAAPFTGSRGDAEFRDELEESSCNCTSPTTCTPGWPLDDGAAARRSTSSWAGLRKTIERQRERRGLPFVDTLRQDPLLHAVRDAARQSGASAWRSPRFSPSPSASARPARFSAPSTPCCSGRCRSPIRSSGDDLRQGRSWRRTMSSVQPDLHRLARPGAQLRSRRRVLANATVTVSAGGDTEYLRGKRVTPSMFEGAWRRAGARPDVHRRRPDPTGRDPGAMAFWKRHFGSSPHVVGQTLRIMDAPFTVVGVMPPGFHIDPPDGEQLYPPLPLALIPIASADFSGSLRG